MDSRTEQAILIKERILLPEWRDRALENLFR